MERIHHPLRTDRHRVAATPCGWFGRLVQSLLIQPLLRFFVPTSVTGSEHLPTTGPAIVVANHTSHLDVPVLHGVLGRRARSRVVVAAAKDYFFASRAAGALVRQVFGAFPFERDGDSSASLMACRAALTEGRILVLFPEGTRSPSGELGRVRSGAARLAESTGTPIIPVRVDGLATVMPKGTRLPLPGAVHASIGPPIIPTGDVESTRRLVERALAREAIESDRRAA